jgi:hypothetical protein
VATSIKYASKADRDEAFSTGMTEGMEMNYKVLDGVLAAINNAEARTSGAPAGASPRGVAE